MKTIFLILSLCLLPVLTYAAPSKTHRVPTAIADSLPWFAVREISDMKKPFTKASLQSIASQNNRVALVYFATWCLPCRVGISKLAKSSDELKQNGVAIVLVNIGERDEKSIKAWLKKVDADNILVVDDPFKRMTDGFGFVRPGSDIKLPLTLVVDSNAKPVIAITEEGEDWPKVLWSY